MSKLIDMTGKRYGMLEVIGRAPRRGKQGTFWECKCDCGNTTIVSSSGLKRGTRSCGCLKGIVSKQRSTTHGMTKSKLYYCWSNVKQRCCCETNKAFKNYGGRGIKMCEDWKNSFESFARWAASAGYKEGLTIERIDVNGDYCPENCKWISLSDQATNRRSNIVVDYNGESHCLSEWCEMYDVDYYLVYNRMHKNHWSFERAIFEPAHVEKRNKKAVRSDSHFKVYHSERRKRRSERDHPV